MTETKNIPTPSCGCADAPIACDLGVFTPDQRAEHARATRWLFEQVQTCHEAPNTLLFELEHTPNIESELNTWIARELRCCPFFQLSTSVDTTRARLQLRVVGPPGATDILRAELDALGIRLCPRPMPAHGT